MTSTWMVVEDAPDVYDTLLAMLEIWGVDGIAFTNGTDAIDWINDVDRDRSELNLPELAILDIRLPGASGPEISSRLRKSPVFNNIAIVLITAYHLSPQEEKDVMAQSQADTIIYKPLPGPIEFRGKLQTIITKRKKTV